MEPSNPHKHAKPLLPTPNHTKKPPNKHTKTHIESKKHQKPPALQTNQTSSAPLSLFLSQISFPTAQQTLYKGPLERRSRRGTAGEMWAQSTPEKLLGRTNPETPVNTQLPSLSEKTRGRHLTSCLVSVPPGHWPSTGILT